MRCLGSWSCGTCFDRNRWPEKNRKNFTRTQQKSKGIAYEKEIKKCNMQNLLKIIIGLKSSMTITSQTQFTKQRIWIRLIENLLNFSTCSITLIKTHNPLFFLMFDGSDSTWKKLRGFPMTIQIPKLRLLWKFSYSCVPSFPC